MARALKKHNPDVYIVAVEPASSPVLEGGKAAPHRIQGIGANFVPGIYEQARNPSTIHALYAQNHYGAFKTPRPKSPC